jgi:hypothetical protein
VINIPTIDCYECERLAQHLDQQKYDNPEVQIRVGIGKKLDEKFYQDLRVIATRTANLTSGLKKYAKYYDERAEWPASPYYTARVKEHIAKMEGRHDCDLSEFFQIEEIQFNHPFTPGSSYSFSIDDPRVRQVKNKAAGCPKGGTKGDHWPEAQQYAEKVKASGDWNLCYSCVQGIRTQPGPPGEGKARIIEMVSVSDYIRGYEALADALTQTDSRISTSMPIMLFHTEPSKLAEWFGKFEGEVTDWLSWDWSSYDASLAAQLLEAGARYLIGGYPYVDLEIDFVLNASIMTSWGTVTRFGAMISGWIGTNIVDSICNVMHMLKVLESLGLLRYVVCVLVNGDDIVVGFSTSITKDNLDKINTRSFMSANTTKVDVGNYLWHSKLIIEKDTSGKIIVSRIPELVYNRIKYPERRKDVDKWIITMGMANTLEDLVIEGHEHPRGREVLRHFAKVDDLDINSVSDAELMPAAEIMVGDLSWRDVSTPQEWIDYIRSTAFVRGDY